MKTITPAQLKMIHVLLNEHGIMERKPELVHSFSDGRTTSSRELYLNEAKSLIEYLKGCNDFSEYITRIWYLAYSMGIIQAGDRNEAAMNAASLDAFCTQRGTIKKPIRKQSLAELKKTVRQFEAMYQKYQQRQNDQAKLEGLKRCLDVCIENESYEMAAGIKKDIDTLSAKLQPKYKRISPSTAHA